MVHFQAISLVLVWREVQSPGGAFVHGSIMWCFRVALNKACGPEGTFIDSTFIADLAMSSTFTAHSSMDSTFVADLAMSSNWPTDIFKSRGCDFFSWSGFDGRSVRF